MEHISIKFVNKVGDEIVLRDVTIGKVYVASVHSKGSIDAGGLTCVNDTLCIVDDAGDSVSIWAHDTTFTKEI